MITSGEMATVRFFPGGKLLILSCGVTSEETFEETRTANTSQARVILEHGLNFHWPVNRLVLLPFSNVAFSKRFLPAMPENIYEALTILNFHSRIPAAGGEQRKSRLNYPGTGEL